MSDQIEPPFPEETPPPVTPNATPGLNPAIPTPHVTPQVAPQVETKPKRQGNYKNAAYKVLELTDEQKTFVASHWANPEWPLKRITQHVFNDNTLDGHHTEGKSVRAYIATLGQPGTPTPKPFTALNPPKKGRYELTADQKTNIEVMLNQDEPPSTKEIFRLVFPDVKEVSYIGAEYQALCRFIKETNEEAIDIWEEPVTERRYKPPGSWAILLGIVNKCVGNPRDINKALYDPNKMKGVEERNIKALFSYMRRDMFINRASSYQKKVDRDTFLSTFIVNVQDKAADLTPEEVEAYSDLAAETVQAMQIDREVDQQQKLLAESFEGDDTDGSKAKASMSLVDSLNNTRDKRKESKNRIDRLRKDLSGSRKDRLDSKSVKNDHLGNWFAAWVEEQTRQDIIELGKKEHADDRTEYGRIKSMDDSWALIAGMTEDEASKGLG